MIYVMSDIHGEYEKYKAMLEKINFSKDDILYVIGDVIDRGENPMDILKDMATRDNVYPIIGNHELMAIEVLNALNVEITDENVETQLSEEVMMKIYEWQLNGGATTLNQLNLLPPDHQQMIIDYLYEFAPYEVVDVNEKTFLLVHAGLGNYKKDKKLKEYSLIDLLWTRPDYDEKLDFDDNFHIVVGHTPTPSISNKAEIYHGPHYINIDCGATFPYGKLACLCLDTFEEFYI